MGVLKEHDGGGGRRKSVKLPVQMQYHFSKSLISIKLHWTNCSIPDDQ